MTGPWRDSEGEEPGPDAEDWRGDQHPDDWPEYLAGPEYWLNKEGDDEPSSEG